MSNDANDTGQDPALADPGADAVAAGELRQFVTFIAGDEVFAVDMAPVQEIIRVPETVRVPLAPPSLDGLANLRGKVLPIISLRRLFGIAEKPADDSTRALVIDLGQPLGFVVDRVSSVVGVDPASIEDVGSLRSTVNSDLLCGLIKNAGGHAMIMVLDFARLIESEFAAIAALAKRGSAAAIAGRGAAADDDEVDADELQLVSFDVAGQEYAIAIEDVQEIVQAPEQIARVPRSAEHMLGVMTLRNRLLPLASLRCLFKLPARATDEHSRIVVVALGDANVGLVMDSVNEVLRVARADVDPLPALMQRDGNLSDITSICRLDGGRRLVSIISASALFNHSTIREVLDTVDTLQQEGSSEDEALEDEEQVVVFRLDKEEFGAPIDSVQEIVRVPEVLTHVPKAPAFVEGVINLRGIVLPVIDLRRRLGLPSVERSDRQRVIVFVIGGVRTGFIVDSVAEVLKIHKSAIEPAPRLSGEQALLLARMANLEKQKRMVQLIEPSRLIENGDLDEIAALAA